MAGDDGGAGHAACSGDEGGNDDHAAWGPSGIAINASAFCGALDNACGGALGGGFGGGFGTAFGGGATTCGPRIAGGGALGTGPCGAPGGNGNCFTPQYSGQYL